MRINYNVTGADRKALVRAMVELLGEPPVYQGAPSFAYCCRSYRVDKDGMVSVPDDASSEDIHKLVELLRRRGFQPTSRTLPKRRSPPIPQMSLNRQKPMMPRCPLWTTGLRCRTVASPRKRRKPAEDCRQQSAPAQESIGTDSLEIVITDTTIRFPWFTLHGIDGEADAYNRLVTAMCKMAKGQKRVVAKECATDNEKFAMRLFLIRLGFIGDEYKNRPEDPAQEPDRQQQLALRPPAQNGQNLPRREVWNRHG